METVKGVNVSKGFSVPYILNGEFYEIIAQEGESVTVRCCYCESRNIYKGSIRSTGNFHMHIKRKHPFLLPRVQEVKLNSYIHRRSRQRNKIEVSKIEVNRTQNIKREVQPEREQPTVYKILNSKVRNEPGPSKREQITNRINFPEDLRTTPTAVERPSSTSTSTENLIQRVDELLTRVENTMRGIEKELGVRNQVETNKLFLDFAKFKYIHPNFTFN